MTRELQRFVIGKGEGSLTSATDFVPKVPPSFVPCSSYFRATQPVTRPLASYHTSVNFEDGFSRFADFLLTEGENFSGDCFLWGMNVPGQHSEICVVTLGWPLHVCLRRRYTPC